jgi:hypothetical protein
MRIKGMIERTRRKGGSFVAEDVTLAGEVSGPVRNLKVASRLGLRAESETHRKSRDKRAIVDLGDERGQAAAARPESANPTQRMIFGNWL